MAAPDGDASSTSVSSNRRSRCSTKPQSTPSMEEKIQRLKRMLLRLATFVEEAEGRRITNHSMLHQVNMLRQDMHRGFKKAYEEEMNEYDDDKACVDDLGVLPITGPAKVGKSTLVEHVCYDERLFMGQFMDLSNLADMIQASLYEGSWHNLRERLILSIKRIVAKEMMNQSLLSKVSRLHQPAGRSSD
ncbi:hypothetical protein E2562_027747 [Oryza meyeriana var. granulata]|uniref:Rx N-terminal domain-containing protein n=1 Tax=Oryza meyeriana var. granulata TaxID=110450 RepID=A0A6G1EQG4_9ORYZ|nr:hypothetical protein E2562_027747 [Oryza meyeriana var. granulata]